MHMPVAGAVVAPLKRGLEKSLSEKLSALTGVSVEGVGEKGIALVLEADSVDALHEISESISKWDEVADFQLAYLNWEDAAEAK
jgi:nitrate reductase NapAB chaperone NapD